MRGPPLKEDTMKRTTSVGRHLVIRGLRHNNLKGFDLDIPVGAITAVTGVSGSGKSSLAFDTLYAEGQRRYVECLSSYARQFLERMDRPDADEIEGIMPTVALEQSKRLRAARSTVATLTEASEYLKVVFAHAAVAHCPNGHGPLSRASTSRLTADVSAQAAGQRAAVTFQVRPLSEATASLATHELHRLGFRRLWRGGRARAFEQLAADEAVDVLVDRLVVDPSDSERLFEALQTAMDRGHATLWLAQELALTGVSHRESTGKFIGYDIHATLRCGDCGHETTPPSPNVFSWNSPVGACETCNGFGRIMTLDEGRCIPDPRLSLAQGAIKPWTTTRTEWEREQLHRFCDAAKIDLHTPWRDLPEAHQTALMNGYAPGSDESIPGAERYFGLREWFNWLEGRTYRMHVRVLLSRYRRYVTCPSCEGTRLKPAAMAWQLAGRDLGQWYRAPISQLLSWLDEVGADGGRSMEELRRRIALLDELGLGYLNLSRPGRSLSGGELQRVQLVTALASGLSQVLYVLDEPSVGLHPRDSARLLRVLDRLKKAGNTVVMVEHDPSLMLAADHLIDLGPAAGAHGGQLVYAGPPASVVDAPDSLTGDYLSGRKQVIHRESAVADDGTLTPRQIAAKARELDRARTTKSLDRRWLLINDPRARNLKGGIVRFRRGRLNVICGVSGSGKSTLLEEVVHRGALRALGKSTEAPGEHHSIEGMDAFEAVVLVEQAPSLAQPRQPGDLSEALGHPAQTPRQHRAREGPRVDRVDLLVQPPRWALPGL